jgi:hypothetical protein
MIYFTNHFIGLRFQSFRLLSLKNIQQSSERFGTKHRMHHSALPEQLEHRAQPDPDELQCLLVNNVNS